ncbi:hypothetical protein KJE20_13250 [Pyrenophora tritici-repentis]|uniref:Uncharacterized protein n=1 Tax=Pyrenophora tritici-repentis TaxID=45151 RepID=A0A922T0W1_9PLEO|nr:hypothetical protein Ptr86124_006105 [Pyrenophora tritici-repentis]KAI1677161.1 hypothetical protein KJE20_13250 [Pyrenophora tritici-repentis]
MCSNIIQFKHAGNDSNYPNHQQARADPNQSLKEVFGIDNIFTNKTDKKKPFIEKVEKIMWEAMKANSFRDDGDWRDLRNQAIVFFDEYMKECDTELINLAELTQFIVIKQSLWYLFESAQEALETSKTQFNDVKFIGRRINELWIQSKMTEAELDGAKPPIWSDEKDLHAALRRVTISKKTFDMPGMFPEDVTDDKPGDTTTLDPTKPTENPMNLLLPAYETMWRVVMRCFLEIKHRGAPNRSDWTAILRGYLEDLGDPNCKPNDAFHKSSATASSVRPVEIVKETLRLYPPTRRVHRMYYDEQVAANIEECHRFDILGGQDPLTFRPERWQNICTAQRQDFYDKAALSASIQTDWLNYRTAKDTLKNEEAKLGYMPFAHYCAADHPKTKEFASKMIALVVAVLCNGLKDEWELVDPTSLPLTGVPLDSDRAAYEGLKLKRKA